MPRPSLARPSLARRSLAHLSLVHLAVAAVMVAPPAAEPARADGWQARITEHDRQRLAREPAALGTGLRAALQNGAEADVAALLDTLARPPRPIDPEALVGDWRCRTMKLGGGFSALTVYRYFTCRITFGPDGLLFEKPTGSQRKLGDLYPDWASAPTPDAVTGFVYLGTIYYSDEEPRAYGRAKPTYPDFREEVGLLTMPAPDRAILALPWPTREADYTILDLRR